MKHTLALFNALLLAPLVVHAADGQKQNGENQPKQSVTDPTKPTYHLISPAGNAHVADPNFAIFWKGRYHLFFIAGIGVFAHVSSTDMVHWRWHPDWHHRGCSGSIFVNKQGIPTLITTLGVPGTPALFSALDDDLEKWSAPVPIKPKVRPDQDGSKISDWDPEAWVENGITYAVFGAHPLMPDKEASLVKSTDLKNWEYVGPFLAKEMPDVSRSKDFKTNDDLSCPNFFKLGNKWMLLCISHRRGCRYYLGDWKAEQFIPDFHGWMNWSQEDVANSYGHGGDCFAPRSLLTPDGRRVMWAWLFAFSKQRMSPTWHEVLSLPRELSLPSDGILRIKPLKELEQLRHDPVSETNIVVESGRPDRLTALAGDTLEIKATITPGTATACGVRVLCDKANGKGLDVVVEPANKTIKLGSTTAPLELKPGEDIQLRIFVDRSVVEVFANDRQAVVKQHGYPPEDVGVCLFSEGGNMKVRQVNGWQMR